MVVTLIVQLWAHEGLQEDMAAYEDAVLGLLLDHGGQVLVRVQIEPTEVDAHEIQVLQFPSEQDYEQFVNDPRRKAMSAERDRVVLSTSVARGHAI